jgi:hypothetical protein
MKHKRTIMKRSAGVRDHGKDLFDTLVFLMLLLAVLWYLNI